MAGQRRVLAVNLRGERVDGGGYLTHPLHTGELDEAVAVWRRLVDAGLLRADAWCWSVESD